MYREGKQLNTDQDLNLIIQVVVLENHYYLLSWITKKIYVFPPLFEIETEVQS